MKYSLAIIIVNYRTADLTIGCLGSIEAEAAAIDGAVAVIVDNASGDGSIDAIERAIAERGWGGWTRVIRSPVNGGFAAGNNVALRAVEADRYLLLNSDTIVRPGAIAELMRVMGERPKVGLLSPRLEWPDGRAQESCFRFRTPITEMLTAARTAPLTSMFALHEGTMPVSDEPVEPDWTTFACCLIRREVLDQIGLLDEGYFMYFDDIDLCRRARQAGWSVLHWPAARVVHLRGQSGPLKKTTAELKRRPAYFYASRNRYFARFYGRLGLWLANVLWELGRGVSLVRELIGRKKSHICEGEARDIWINAINPMKPPHGRSGA